MSSPFLHVFQMNRKGLLPPQIVRTGAMLQCYSKRGKLSHSDKELVLGFFFSIIAAIRSCFPLALSSMHTYRSSKPLSPRGFGYDALLLLSPQF